MLVYLGISKNLSDVFVNQKENPQKPLAKVKRTREEMQTTLENSANNGIGN